MNAQKVSKILRSLLKTRSTRCNPAASRTGRNLRRRSRLSRTVRGRLNAMLLDLPKSVARWRASVEADTAVSSGGLESRSRLPNHRDHCKSGPSSTQKLSASQRRSSVLCKDHQRGGTSVLGPALAKLGYAVERVPDVEAGLARIFANPLDLVLHDASTLCAGVLGTGRTALGRGSPYAAVPFVLVTGEPPATPRSISFRGHYGCRCRSTGARNEIET